MAGEISNLIGQEATLKFCRTCGLHKGLGEFHNQRDKKGENGVSVKIMSYQMIMQDEELLKELEDWADVCLTVDMNDWPEGLGGYVPEAIPERFKVLAEARKSRKCTMFSGVTAIIGQWGQHKAV